MLGYKVLIDRLNGTLPVYRPNKTTAMLTLACLAENSFKNRSIGLVGLIVSLKNNRNGRGFASKWAWLQIFRVHLRATILLESPFTKSWIRHWVWKCPLTPKVFYTSIDVMGTSVELSYFICGGTWTSHDKHVTQSYEELVIIRY